MIFLNQQLFLESTEYIQTASNPNGLVPEHTYNNQKHRGQINVYGRGGNGRRVLIEYESLPQNYKIQVAQKYGDPYEYVRNQVFHDLVKPDNTARNFFANYRKYDGSSLPITVINKYSTSCSLLNVFKQLLSDKKMLRSNFALSVEQFWDRAAAFVKTFSADHSLPTSTRRLRAVYQAYLTAGYAAIISKKIGNTNSKKVTETLERLILSIYTSGKPYASDVCTALNQFFEGKLSVIDQATGELYDPAQFSLNDTKMSLSKKTVWNYINIPHNRNVVDLFRVSAFEYQNKVAPHNHRHAPSWAFSKISMDDLELPFLMENGKRVKSYQIFDVASGCVIGKAFGNDKNRELFLDAVRDMFALIVKSGWGVPAEIEVERNIASTFKQDLLKAGNVFPFVRFCKALNPQEKRAEHGIAGKKLSVQQKREGFQGRWYARREAIRPNIDKPATYTYDEIVANELFDINAWNNSLHPNQKKYPGLSRWQVLCQNINPQLEPVALHSISRYIGRATQTSIKRNRYVTVQHNEYTIPQPQCLQQLDPGNYSVTAYYIPDESGIPEIHIYQNDIFICTCQMSERYNEAMAERTAADDTIRLIQSKYTNKFMKQVKGMASLLSSIRTENPDAIHDIIASVPCPSAPSNLSAEPPQVTSKEKNVEHNSIPEYSDPQYWINKAQKDL
jgi:hypothetical protein